MSNVAALLYGRSDAVGDGVYLERTDPKELALEEHLRAWLARVPRLVPLARRWRRMVNLANAHEPAMKNLDDAALVETFRSACAPMRRRGFDDALVAQAFAAVREAATRTVGMRHFDVQLVGGWTLLQGRIAEMETGEGKTLVATLAACTAASAGAAVHVVTVNDYLAARDAETNGPLYRFMGLSVGVIKQDMPLPERRAQYACDIVYVSNKELVFDYLKDRIAAGATVAAHLRLRQLYRPGAQPGMLLRGLHMAIVDEADSVLIDEARTPLIISETRPDELGEALYQKAIELARRMKAGEHYEISRNHEVWIKPAGEDAAVEWAAGLAGVWKSAVWRRELLQKALTAVHCYHRDRHYIIAENKVQIVDEFTGRVMPDRSWEQGLHQMIEAKEGCEITGQRKTLSRLTYQRFFRRYLLLAGMTGTASEVAPELRRVYDLDVVRIPTNKPSRRRRRPRDRARPRRPLPPHRNALSRSLRAPRRPARRARRRAHRAQRAPGQGRGQSRCAGGPGGKNHRGHQHGRPRHRHPPRAGSAGTRRPPRHPHRVPRKLAHRPAALRTLRAAGRAGDGRGDGEPGGRAVSAFRPRAARPVPESDLRHRPEVAAQVPGLARTAASGALQPGNTARDAQAGPQASDDAGVRGIETITRKQAVVGSDEHLVPRHVAHALFRWRA